MIKRNLYVLSSLIVIVIVGLLVLAHMHPMTAASAAPVVPQPQILYITNNDVPALAALINKDRTDAGLVTLVEDGRLEAAAQSHCNDMVRLNEWDHYLSDGTKPQTFILAQVSDVKWTAENTTWGWNTPATVNNKLMASPEHKANILDTRLTNVGYAICNAPSYPNIMVQEFAGL